METALPIAVIPQRQALAAGPGRQRRPPCAAPNRPLSRSGHDHAQCLSADTEQFCQSSGKIPKHSLPNIPTFSTKMFFLAVCKEGLSNGTARTEPQSPLASWHSRSAVMPARGAAASAREWRGNQIYFKSNKSSVGLLAAKVMNSFQSKIFVKIRPLMSC